MKHFKPTKYVLSRNKTGSHRQNLANNIILFYGATGPHQCPCFTITLRHTTLGRTPLDEWSARYRDYVTTLNNQDRHPSIPPVNSNPQSQEATGAAHPRVRPYGHWDRRLTTLDWGEGKIDHGYQQASILRVVKRRFSVSFLSLHHPNNRSENSHIKLLLGRRGCRGISAPLASTKLSLRVQLNTRTA